MNEQRVIDASALIQWLQENRPLNWNDTEAEVQEQIDWENFIAIIEDAPTIVPESLVNTEIFVKGLTSTGNEPESKKTYYLCDRRNCKKCSYPRCKRTSNIEHARNFKKDGYGNYEEKDKK